MKGKGNGNKGMIEDGRELREEKKGMRSKYNREKRGRKVRSGKEKRRKGGGREGNSCFTTIDNQEGLGRGEGRRGRPRHSTWKSMDCCR